MERLPAFVQGASRGIGAGLSRLLLERGHRVFAASRNPQDSEVLEALKHVHEDRLELIAVDVEDESTVEDAAAMVAERSPKLGLVFNVAGLLHDGDKGPERRVQDIDPAWLQRTYAVNAIGPLLVAKHFARLLQHEERSVLANLSARVGSIEDDQLGGWYGYRASKAAQNMFTKNLSIELTRRFGKLIVLALHPGTVDTQLSKPFQRGVPEHKLFSVERAARQLLDIIEDATPKDNGAFFAWDGTRIPW